MWDIIVNGIFVLASGEAGLLGGEVHRIAAVDGGDHDHPAPLADFDDQGKFNSSRDVAKLESSIEVTDRTNQWLAELFVFALNAGGGRFDGRQLI